MRERERENITGFFFWGQEESCRPVGSKVLISFFEFFEFCFVLPALKRKLYSCCCKLQKQHPETKKKLHPCCCKFKKHHPESKKKTASLLLQTQETPPETKKNCILVAANSRNTTQRPKNKQHPCCCKLMKHHPETKTAFLLLQLKKHHPETYRELLKVVHVNKKFHAPLERETLKNIAK